MAVPLLLAAILTVTQTRRKRNWSLCSRQELHLDAGVAGHAEPQASQRPGPVSGEVGGSTPGQAVKTNLVSSGWCRQDQAVIERLVSG